MSHFLADRGIRILDGFKAEHVSPGLDLVIVGNAVTRENPEIKKMTSVDTL
jgi:UDP-N-acetylmuramate: L-alanyl-gamma-D-glutamyl-meso-diaminopimelate ligase